jgi:hypothetical protein
MAPTSGDPWFHLMVGQWWTPEIDLGVLSAAATKRQMTSAAWRNFSEHLREQLSTSLNPDLQKGMTADNLREAFQWGADQASGVAKTNGVISKAHASAYHCASELNSRLKSIAADGKAEINRIQQSKDLPPIKLGRIVDEVLRRQGEANSAAAPSTQNIFEAMQHILDQRGIQVSSRQFAQQHGIDTTRMLRSSNKEAVTEKVKGLLDGGGPPESPGTNNSSHHLGGRTEDGSSVSPMDAKTDGSHHFGDSGAGGDAHVVPAGRPGPAAQGPPDATHHFGDSGENAPPVSAFPGATGGSGFRSPTAPSVSAPLPTNALPTGAPLSPPTLAAGAQPNALIQAFDSAPGSGLPTSPALSNVPPPVTAPVQPQISTGPAISDAAASAPAHAPAFDAPQATTATPISSTHATVTDSGATYLAGPAAASAAPAAPAGPLPTYASDIRPPTPAVSAPTLPSGPSAPAAPSAGSSPSSAPVSPSAGTGGLAQPVVRQPGAAAIAHPAPAGIGEQAVAASAGGAAVGAASAQATAQARLQRLVDFVAHQEPRLRWAAGDRQDGTTVLVTDLASGWIPPGIAIPSVVSLVEPGDRRGDIDSLLGLVSCRASYTPLHYLPEAADETNPIPTSPRPRQVPAVDELGWELGRATNWRDGLPQMAHTLAKAASTGTGVADKEVEFLHQHLATLVGKVFSSYPDDVDAAAVANWQLLASIDALAASDNIGANYHFAWFQALNYVP